MSTIAERVAKGAALLDAEQPGWADRIDLDELELESCRHCVLGQLFSGGCPDPEACLGCEDGFEHVTNSRPELDFPALGFDKSRTDGDGAYSELTAEWRRLISERRAAA